MVGCPTSKNRHQVDESSARKGLDDHSGASYRSSGASHIPRQVERNPVLRVLRENDSMEST